MPTSRFAFTGKKSEEKSLIGDKKQRKPEPARHSRLGFSSEVLILIWVTVPVVALSKTAVFSPCGGCKARTT
ncbi:MAG: hypothetical protein CMJ81_15040 [Planctomycetaceae bacterium]|nr:hypothetical protein [Planctomycetaceae bacterium]MBP61806.1 hypothetical protein [Planctomycetaceae bacterium]